MNRDSEQSVKDRAKIKDVVEQFLELRRSGATYKAKCPFHEERTPSFTVTPSKGTYKCFGCGEGGDAIAFLMKYKRLTYPEALQWLADFYNIDTGSQTGDTPAAYRPPIRREPRPEAAPAAPDYMDKAVFLESLTDHSQNSFWRFLCNRFGQGPAADAAARYYLGSDWSEKGKGQRVVFWQIDKAGNIRGGKVMSYDAETGKRKRATGTTWMHAVLERSPYNLRQCFFGEHLLSALHIDQAHPVAIVESEKTAIVASLYLANLQFIWLAAGGLDGLNDSGKWEALRGRKIILYPDLGPPDKDGKTPFERWKEKAAEIISRGYDVSVNTYLEGNASEFERGEKYDLADFLLRRELSEFQDGAPF